MQEDLDKQFAQMKADERNMLEPYEIEMSKVDAEIQSIIDSYFWKKVEKHLGIYFLVILAILIIPALYIFIVAGLGGLIFAGLLLTPIVGWFSRKFANADAAAKDKAGERYIKVESKKVELQSTIDEIIGVYNDKLFNLFNKWTKYPPDWDFRRELVKERDGHVCTECGWPSGFKRRRRKLHVHHLVPLSKGGDNSLENLVTLCSHCHRALHPGSALGA